MMFEFLRAARRAAQFTAVCGAGAWRSPVAGPLGRADWMCRQATRLADVVGLSVEADGIPAGAQLVVANHLGYLDILALGCLQPMTFVSKAEVAAWPAFGAIARRAGTIFLDREKRGAVVKGMDVICERVAAGIPVVFFPEGTSSDGSSVLPFHASLFEAAVREGWRVVPVALAYELPDGGDPGMEVAYWGGMTFAAHFLHLLTHRRITARIRCGAPRVAEGDRKHFARQIHSAVAGLHETLLYRESYSSAGRDAPGGRHPVESLRVLGTGGDRASRGFQRPTA